MCIHMHTCQLGEALHTQLTSLVGRLHDGELERHSLHAQLAQTRAECQQLSEAHQQAVELRRKSEELQNEVEMTLFYKKIMSSS